MIISINSLKNFCILNSFLTILGFFQHEFNLFCYKRYSNNHLYFVPILLFFILRNYSLVNFIENITNNKNKINNDISLIPKEDYKYEFHVNLITSTLIETITHLFIREKMMINNYVIVNISHELFYFIPISFIFEIIFDFFHYFTHRLLHHKYFYRFLHKKHHKFKHPLAITTFYQDPFDLIITNSIPTVITLFIIPKISYLQYNFIIIYKSFIEISGHSGKLSYPTSSFVQFIWLPKMLNIELYTEDHDLHHSLNNCNYSKRFSLWDKVFNTYRNYH